MKKISFVIPCYCSSLTINSVVSEITTKMQIYEYNYEIILVNDSSLEDTFNKITELCISDKHIIGIDLAKNFGQHAAIMAGLLYVSGDIIICLDDDGQTPADEVDKLLKKIEEGYDAVYASYENKQHTLFRKFGSWLNSKMAESMLGKPRKLYISSYFAVQRFIVEEVKKYGNPYPYLPGLILRTSGKICSVPVNHRKREAGRSGYSLKKLITLWINGFTSFSVKPLRMATVGGVVTAVTGFLYAVRTIIRKLMRPDIMIGWSSTIAVILIIGGMILCVLGMIGEYVGRIYICMNNSPQYVIRKIVNGKRNEDVK